MYSKTNGDFLFDLQNAGIELLRFYKFWNNFLWKHGGHVGNNLSNFLGKIWMSKVCSYFQNCTDSWSSLNFTRLADIWCDLKSFFCWKWQIFGGTISCHFDHREQFQVCKNCNDSPQIQFGSTFLVILSVLARILHNFWRNNWLFST